MLLYLSPDSGVILTRLIGSLTNSLFSVFSFVFFCELLFCSSWRHRHSLIWESKRVIFSARDTVSYFGCILVIFLFLDHGLIKVETTTRGNENGTVEFKTNATHNLTNEKLAGNVDIKYKVAQHGKYSIEFELI